MFKLAIISTLATSAVNALELDADADAMAELDRFSFPQPDDRGLFSGTFSKGEIAPIGHIGDIDFDKRRSTRRSGPRRSVPLKRSSAKERELRK